MNYGKNHGVWSWSSKKNDSVFTPYDGAESDDFPGMECWKINKLDALNLQGALTFLHATRQPENLDKKEIENKSSKGEFGAGFYTTCGGDLDGSRLLGEYWFEAEEKNKKTKDDWLILRFVIDASLTSKVGLYGSSTYKNEIDFFLSTPRGYPSGQSKPTEEDLQVINAINREGKVLIFPDDKTIKVSYGKKGDKKSWDEFEGGKGEEMYTVIVGPQKPKALTMRQQCWSYPAGIWLINSAKRHQAFDRAVGGKL